MCILQRFIIPVSSLIQERVCSPLNLVPLKVSSSCCLEELFLATVASGFLIKDLNLNPDLCKAALH